MLQRKRMYNHVNEDLGFPSPAVHEHPVKLKEVGIVEHPTALTAGDLRITSPSSRLASRPPSLVGS